MHSIYCPRLIPEEFILYIRYGNGCFAGWRHQIKDRRVIHTQFSGYRLNHVLAFANGYNTKSIAEYFKLTGSAQQVFNCDLLVLFITAPGFYLKSFWVLERVVNIFEKKNNIYINIFTRRSLSSSKLMMPPFLWVVAIHTSTIWTASS